MGVGQWTDHQLGYVVCIVGHPIFSQRGRSYSCPWSVIIFYELRGM